jgi:hypothetical protein
MSIKKNGSAEDLESDTWFKFSDGPIHVQPIGAHYIADIHSIKALQGFYLSAPCGLDELGRCHLCATYPLRTGVFMLGWDCFDEKEKILKLPKVGGRVFLELLRDEQIEDPTTVEFEISRSQPGNRYDCRVAAQNLPPRTSDREMEELLLAWMQPEHLRRFIYNFDKLNVSYREGGDSEVRWVEVDEPDI